MAGGQAAPLVRDEHELMDGLDAPPAHADHAVRRLVGLVSLPLVLGAALAVWRFSAPGASAPTAGGLRGQYILGLSSDEARAGPASSSDQIDCAGDFGQQPGDPVCCSQPGIIFHTHERHICAEAVPYCHDFLQNKKWGHCETWKVGEPPKEREVKALAAAKKKEAERAAKEKAANEKEKAANEEEKAAKEKAAKTKVAKEKEADKRPMQNSDKGAAKAAAEIKAKEARWATDKAIENKVEKAAKEKAAKDQAAERKVKKAAKNKKSNEKDDDGLDLSWLLPSLIVMIPCCLVCLILLGCCEDDYGRVPSGIDWRELLLDSSGHHLDLPFVGGSDEFDRPEEWDKELRNIKDAMLGWPMVLVVQVTTNLSDDKKFAQVKCGDRTVSLRDLLQLRAKRVKQRLHTYGISDDKVAVGEPQFNDPSGGSRLHFFARKLTIGELRTALTHKEGHALDLPFVDGSDEFDQAPQWDEELKAVKDAFRDWPMSLAIEVTTELDSFHMDDEVKTTAGSTITLNELLTNRARKISRYLGGLGVSENKVTINPPKFDDPHGRGFAVMFARPQRRY
mmetsp:Transcript_108239/g.305057  ORF Transcript_108239/g.305057 Transcript_108239/m.305057 type:complete len:565 (+) Transcript_108239:57-1751(+)